MSDGSSDEALIDALLQARETGRPYAMPGEFAATRSLGDAGELHRRHIRRVLDRLGGEVIGIKLGGTTEAALRALGLHAPFVGPIFSALAQQSPACARRSDFLACIVEAEIGVRLGRDLEASSQTRSRDELLASIDAVFPALEIADSRLADWAAMPASAIVADLGYAGAWVRGEIAPVGQRLDLVGLPVTLTRDGDVVRSGSGALVLGDPLHALSLALVELGREGRRLPAGTLISTGSCTVPLPVAGTGRFVADFGPLGRVELQLV